MSNKIFLTLLLATSLAFSFFAEIYPSSGEFYTQAEIKQLSAYTQHIKHAREVELRPQTEIVFQDPSRQDTRSNPGASPSMLSFGTGLQINNRGYGSAFSYKQYCLSLRSVDFALFEQYKEQDFYFHFCDRLGNIHTTDNTRQIIHILALHCFPAFRNFIMTLNDYCPVMIALKNSIDHPDNKKLRKKLRNVDGFKKNDFIRYLNEQVSLIHDALAQQQAREKQKQETRKIDARVAQDKAERQLIDEVALLHNKKLEVHYNNYLEENYLSDLDAINDAEYQRVILRRDALKKTRLDKGSKFTRHYDVAQTMNNYATNETLAHCKELNGTAYQHILQDEFLELYDISARYQDVTLSGAQGQYSLGQDCSARFLHQCVEIGLDFNHEHHDKKATILADLCWGIAEALPQAGLNLALYAFPPMRIFSTLQLSAVIAEKTFHVLRKVTNYCFSESSSDCALSTQPEVYGKAVLEQTATSMQELQKILGALPVETVAREATAFGIELLLTKRVCGAVDTWLGGVRSKITGSSFSKLTKNKLKNCAESLAQYTGVDVLAAWQTVQLCKNYFTEKINSALSGKKNSIPIKREPIKAKPYLNAQGKAILTPCGRPMVELGPFIFSDLHAHEYQEIQDLFKDHLVKISPQKIAHTIFGEIKSNGTHTGGHFDLNRYALNNNGGLLSYGGEVVPGVHRVNMQLLNKIVKKHYFAHDISPVDLFRAARSYLDTPNAIATLENISAARERFEFKIGNIDVVFVINKNFDFITCYPKF